jgi:hypothetical protein
MVPNESLLESEYRHEESALVESVRVVSRVSEESVPPREKAEIVGAELPPPPPALLVTTTRSDEVAPFPEASYEATTK